MAEQYPAPPAEAPVDPLITHAASPFFRTEVPVALAFASPPAVPAADAIVPVAAWSAYKTQIQFGFAILAYLMVLVGCVTVVEANQAQSWRYLVAVVPVLPAGIVIWLSVRSLSRLDDVQKRVQVQAIGFSMVATALLTFGYGFLEEAGMPHLDTTLILPLMAGLWGVGLMGIIARRRFRR